MVELIVTAAITAVVLTVAAGVFFSTLSAGRVVQAGSIVASQAQVAAETITDRVANGSDARLSGGAATGDQFLVVRAAGTGPTLAWRCYAWYYRAADGTLLAADRTTGAPFLAPPTTSNPSGWTSVATSLRPRFAGGIFELAGREVRVGFDLVDPDAAIRIDTGAVLRNPSAASQGAGQQCY